MTCPACGHGILTHRAGQCLAVIDLGGGVKGHCGCTAIQPPNSLGRQMMIDEVAEITPHQIAYVRKRLGLR